MKHLLVALSSHGFGHAAQAAVVVNALRRRIPDLRLTLRTLLPQAFLAQRFEGGFALAPADTDVGMVMHSALDADIAATAEAYIRFHTDWDRRVQEEAEALDALAPDLVLADVPYLALAAASRAAIPAVAMCSLNWADIYFHYYAHRPETSVIHGQMLRAYESAAAFLQTEPAMPMTNLARRIAIGPVARVGLNRRAELKERLGLAARDRVVMIALGGIELRLPFECWPRLPGVHWLVPRSWGVNRPDATATQECARDGALTEPRMQTLSMPFSDLLRSCDAVIGKPGYGTFTEAACSGTPMLYVRRPDWPEEPHLVDWLERHGRCLEVTRAQLDQGDLADALQRLWARPERPPVPPRGVDQAAELIAARWLDVAPAAGPQMSSLARAQKS